MSTCPACQRRSPPSMCSWLKSLSNPALLFARFPVLASCETGVILDAVAGPIRHYLRERKDTIRCIVTMLTDDGAEDVGTLFAELGNTETVGEVRNPGSGGGGMGRLAGKTAREALARACGQLRRHALGAGQTAQSLAAAWVCVLREAPGAFPPQCSLALCTCAMDYVHHTAPALVSAAGRRG
jgi:hypothetical protein